MPRQLNDHLGDEHTGCRVVRLNDLQRIDDTDVVAAAPEAANPGADRIVRQAARAADSNVGRQLQATDVDEANPVENMTIK